MATKKQSEKVEAKEIITGVSNDTWFGFAGGLIAAPIILSIVSMLACIGLCCCFYFFVALASL